MLLSAYRLIYLHPPKTGGNSISRLLLPSSDDDLSAKAHQDGVNRFEVSGAFTPTKHATLADYDRLLPGGIDGYAVAISVRDPFERAISYYFSPHRWQRRRLFRWTARRPIWNIEEFAKALPNLPTIASFLDVNGKPRQADYLIRFDSFDKDLERLASRAGLLLNVSELEHVNRSAGTAEQVAEASADRRARDMVMASFAVDYDLLSRTRSGVD